MREKVAKVVTIAGSDSGAGAGVQADMKTCAALGVYATTVITALTAQNTLGVREICAVTPSFVTAQIDAVMEDIGADAVKTGMLDRVEIVQAVAEALRRWRVERLVVDPVMVAKSGDLLLRREAVRTLVRELFPLAYVVTPNIPEAEVLLGGASLRSVEAMEEGARAIAEMGPRYVVLKGGHLRGDKAIDVLWDGRTFTLFEADRRETRHTHGTGCTFSAAIAACVARGMAVGEAVRQAKQYLTEAITHSFPVGQGHGPVHHFAHLPCWRGER